MEANKQTLFGKDFTLVVIGQIISLFGNAILRFALPLYLLRETGSSSLFGAVTACSFIPMILFSLVGGVLADRVNKRNIMVGLDFGTAGLILIFYLLYGLVPIVPLTIVCLMVLYGISGTYQPSVQASIPVLVEREQLMQANAVINMVSTLSSLLGPVIGGVLFGTWGLTPILLVSVGCFISSAVMEIFIRIPVERQQTREGLFSIIRCDLRESWRFVHDEKPVFIPVVVILALFNMVLSAAIIVGIPVMVVNILGMSDVKLGITQGALGLGGLAGGCLTGILGSRWKLGKSHWLLVSCSVTAAFMGLGLCSFVPKFWGYILISVMSFLTMAVSTLFTIQMCAAVQRQSPSHLLGKIMASIMAVVNCASPLGQAAYGVLFDVCKNIPQAVMFGAALIALMLSMYSKHAFLQLERGEHSHECRLEKCASSEAN